MESSHTKLLVNTYIGSSSLGATSRQRKALFSDKTDFNRSAYKHRRPLAGSGSQQTWQLFSLAIHIEQFDNFVNASAVECEHERTPPFMLSLTL